ncbi:MAG TPA: heavy metal translocating P-type ATPase, partial [Peptococcaceae bacterium]|nr:heavy metal translocating P-type ATPase [Peptococcaceae bacterium]
MAALPGVTGARLNPATGRLIVDGEVDPEAIRREARKENYTVIPLGEAGLRARPGAKGGLVRAGLAAAAFLAAYIIERAGGVASLFIPFYVAAVVIGGGGG